MLLAAALLLAVQQEYLPVPEGTRHVYVVEDLGAEAAAPAREVAAESGRADREGWVGVRDFLGYDQAWVRALEGRVEFRAATGAEAPVLSILKTSAREGETWGGTLGRENLGFTFRGRVPLDLGEERVTALHVEFTVSAPGHRDHASSTGRLWFVAGRGLVRAELARDLDCHTHAVRSYRLK
jgi:hypothetical protein